MSPESKVENAQLKKQLLATRKRFKKQMQAVREQLKREREAKEALQSLNKRERAARLDAEALHRVLKPAPCKIGFLDYKNSVANFSSPDPILSDVVIVVGGEEFHTNKAFLAHFCGYFKALFFSGFAEKGMNRVELTLPDNLRCADAFKNFLELLYPHHGKKIYFDDEVVLLGLAKYFDAPSVEWMVIELLKTTDEITHGGKLLISETYGLPDVQHFILEQLTDVNIAKEVIDDCNFPEFSCDLKSVVYQKHYELCNNSA